MVNTEIRRFLSLLFPCALAILTTESVAVLIFNHSPELKNKLAVAGWWILQAIGGIIFSRISDKHYRRKTLIICQIFGVSSGLILLYFNLNIWFLALIALTFNPLPVARAALLDNFPGQPSLRVIGFTYFLKFTPWVFSTIFGQADYDFSVKFIFLCLLLSTGATIVLFKDPYDKQLRTEHKTPIKWNNKYVIMILIAFIFAEQTFYIEWDEIEHLAKLRGAFPLVTFGTLTGILIATIYPKFPHVSLITICYMLGVAVAASIVFQYYITEDPTFNTLIICMNIYAIIGGLYLPLFADLLISVLGKERRAFGSALAESGEAIASMLAAITSYYILFDPMKIAGAYFILYLASSILQKYSEKLHLEYS